MYGRETYFSAGRKTESGKQAETPTMAEIMAKWPHYKCPRCGLEQLLIGYHESNPAGVLPMTDDQILIWYESLEDSTCNTNTPEQAIILKVRELIRLASQSEIPKHER